MSHIALHEDTSLISSFASRHPAMLLPNSSSLFFRVLGLKQLVEFLRLLHFHSILEVMTTFQTSVLDWLEMLHCFGLQSEWLDSVAECPNISLVDFDLESLHHWDKEIWVRNQWLKVLTQKADYSICLVSINKSIRGWKRGFLFFKVKKTACLR